jgi:hypothetical protein
MGRIAGIEAGLTALRNTTDSMRVSMRTAILALALAMTFQLRTATAQVTPATDPTAAFGQLFGLGGPHLQAIRRYREVVYL